MTGEQYKDSGSEFFNNMAERIELEDVVLSASSVRDVRYTHFQGGAWIVRTFLSTSSEGASNMRLIPCPLVILIL